MNLTDEDIEATVNFNKEQEVLEIQKSPPEGMALGEDCNLHRLVDQRCEDVLRYEKLEAKKTKFCSSTYLR